jgi:diacylglycerol kinase (ATP)
MQVFLRFIPSFSIFLIHNEDKSFQMKNLLIINSYAGTIARHWKDIEPQIREHHMYPTEFQFTEAPGHATEMTRTALHNGYKNIVVLGGDGTINETVNGFFENGARINPEATLGILTGGSGNDTIRTLGISRNVTQAIGQLARGNVMLCDVGRIRCKGTDGKDIERMFFNVADIGIGAMVVQKVNRSSKPFGGKIAFLAATTSTFVRFKKPTLRYSLDDSQFREEKTITLVVANGRWFGGGLSPTPTAKIDDGLFSTAVFGDISIPTYIRKIGYLMRGIPVDHPCVSYATAKKVVVETDDKVLIEADGEIIGLPPATFEILPKAMRVYV